MKWELPQLRGREPINIHALSLFDRVLYRSCMLLFRYLPLRDWLQENH